MSGSTLGVGASNYSIMSQLVANSEAVRQQLTVLTEQAASGLVAETYSGLGPGAGLSLDLNPQIGLMQTWQGNISAAQGQMQVTQTAMTQLSQIASTFNADLNTIQSGDPTAVDTIAASARQALTQVANLLDTTDGAVYVFAGQDSANPPVPNPDQILSSGFFASINSVVSALGTNGAATTETSILAISASNAPGISPFSPPLSQPAAVLQAQLPTVQVGQHQFVSVGLVASANSFVSSTGPSTTGSYMRDLMASLAVIGSLSSQQANLPAFQQLIADTRTTLEGAITAMNQDAGVLGNQQSALANSASTLSDTIDAVTAQVGAVQDVNMASTASQISLVQTQLQASYQVIANMGTLSLVNYL